VVKAQVYEVEFEITHEHGRYLHPTDRRRERESVIIDARIQPKQPSWFSKKDAPVNMSPELHAAITLALTPRGRRMLACYQREEVTPSEQE
jgi:hypothetical protein